MDPRSAAADWVSANPGDGRASAIRQRIVNIPVARWLLRSDDPAYLGDYVRAATAADRVPLLVAYYIPVRDCGSHSAGGAASALEYRDWMGRFADAIGSAPAVVLLEPDSLFYTSCLSPGQLEERLTLVRESLAILASGAPNAVVYLDGGTPVHGTTPEQMADLLVRAGIAQSRGMAVNINNFRTTDDSYDYAIAVARTVRDRTGVTPHFVMDTSRNGGSVALGEWCNPANAAIGDPPTWFQGDDGLDGTVWFKRPGESDGSCGVAPSSVSGQFDPGLAYALVTG